MAVGLASLSPDDFAAILRAAPPGAASAQQRIPFSLNPALLGQGADGTERAAAPSFGPGAQMPDAPQMPAAPAPRPAVPATPLAPKPVAANPMPPARPVELGAPAADMPAPDAVPTSGNFPEPASPAGAAPKPEEPSFLDKIMGGIQKTDGLLGSIGIGLLTTPGLGEGLGAGLKNHQQASVQKAATNLAQAEFQLKQRKLAQESGALAGNAGVIKKAYPNLSDAEATALGSNSSAVTEAAKILRDPNHGRESDPAVIKARAQAQAEGAAAGKPEETTADQKNYEESKKSGYQGSFVDYLNMKGNASRAQTTINNAVNPILKGLGDQFVESAQGARDSANAVRSAQNARAQIDAPGGIFSGAFADNRLALQKLGSALGVADAAAIQNTETFRTQIKPLVLETVKGLGSGSAISNADKDFAEAAVGGKIALDEGTIRRVLDITERAARYKIDRHNGLADQMLETQPELKQVGPMLRVQVPGAQPASADANAPISTPAAKADPLASARAAIAQGADRNKVKTLLLKNGIDPKGL